ncbi:MAG: ATP-binding protein [Methanocellales archaeon]
MNSRKMYILGTRGQANKGLLNLGRYLALDGSLGAEVYFDALHPHVILICGKRGYGKSYSLGVIVEELASLDEAIKNNLAFLIIDTMGIFWTMSMENWREENLLKKWDLKPEKYDLEIFVPNAFKVEFEQRKVKCSSFSVRASDLDAFDWCSMLNISPLEPLGVLIIKTIQKLKETGELFSLRDIASNINEDKKIHPNIRAAAENYLLAVQSWGIFDRYGTPLNELVKGGKISVLDLSCYGHASNVKSAIVATIARQIYTERVKARRNQLLAEMRKISLNQEFPMVWLFIDEAHVFLPRNSETIASNVIVNEWLRLGRQPGLSLVLATQTLAALHREAISHCDLLICHRLTAQEDINALSEVRPIYMRDGIVECMKRLNQDKGAALLLDDTTESFHVVKIRPRKSWHGGGEPNALGNS